MTTWPKPRPPEWALAAGLPAPKRDETFRSYVERIGLDFDELTDDLDDLTCEIANVRLYSQLMEHSPYVFSSYVEARAAAASPGRGRRYSYDR